MKPKIKQIVLICLPVIGILAGYLLMGRDVTALVDGQPVTIHIRALKVEGALHSAGIEIALGDEVTTAAQSWLSKTDTIEVNHTRQVRIRVEPDGKLISIQSSSRTVQEILADAGLTVTSSDRILMDGAEVSLDAPLPAGSDQLLQYFPAHEVLIYLDGEELPLTTSATDVAGALWEAGISVRAGDRLSIPYDAPITEGLELEGIHGRPVTIQVDGIEVNGYSAGETVGQALADAGISLQDLDYCEPAADGAIPMDGKIRVVRVTEELVMEQTALPYETQEVPDASMEINTRKVIQEGAAGIKAIRVRVRYEDGVETSRTDEGEVVIAEAQPRIVNFGTKIVDLVADTPDGPITYYMSATVVATSYSPCRSGVPGKCYTGTSLGLPAQKGVIGVNRAWYNLLKGSKIYVPGYGIGVIADIGYYPSTNYWIDLGYSDADFQSWGASSVTIYFLSPAPPGFTGVLP